jgi:hypothetical protein
MALVRGLQERLHQEFPWVEQVNVVKPAQESTPKIS